MKEAKTEAEKVIANYRAEMEVNYQVSLAKVRLSSIFDCNRFKITMCLLIRLMELVVLPEMNWNLVQLLVLPR